MPPKPRCARARQPTYSGVIKWDARSPLDPWARRGSPRMDRPDLTEKTVDRAAQPGMAWRERNPVKLADRPVIEATETRIKFLEQAELEKPPRPPLPRRCARPDRPT
jgi:hypothetical protein